MKNFNVGKLPLAVLTAVIVSIYTAELSPSPYRLSAETDGIILFSGAVLNSASWYTGRDIDRLSADEIDRLSKNDINLLDRSAADNWSPAADRWSYFSGMLLNNPQLLHPEMRAISHQKA